ncbi:hypothetical protein Salmuc_03177 [Salipiger mucosus DSM 16094]|uniref:O-methyltransferase n=1 Tax=Salipiger mucosus DSM 16094 TaxID=1123237 RepID=S9Q7G3_9RHOB|nr:hypothetical protein Salmuc_03177 [Salipiger mucosus DSM 16094]
MEFVKAESSVWTRESFLEAVNAPDQPPLFARIARRRERLRRLKPKPLHKSYLGRELSHDKTHVTASTISLSPRYGTMLYALARAFGARHALEAGSGYGISSMYLAIALAESGADSRLFSFELASYANQAQRSLDLITHGDSERGKVLREDFNALGVHLPAGETFDLVFIDSRHDRDTLIRSYKTAYGWMAPRSMILIDDIGYSGSSREGWEEMIARNEFPFAALVNERIGVLSA